MPQDFAYKQLLTLIAARAQQWLRNRIDLLPQEEIPDAQIDELVEIALAAHICTDLPFCAVFHPVSATGSRPRAICPCPHGSL